MSGRHWASSDGRLHVKAASALTGVSSRVLPTQHLQRDLQRREIYRESRDSIVAGHAEPDGNDVRALFRRHAQKPRCSFSYTGSDGRLRFGQAAASNVVSVRRQVLLHERATFQPVTHRPGRKLLICLNFRNGYRPAAVNRSGETGGRENAGGGERSSASQQVGALNRAIPGDFRG
jgi:hypothetical protein